jgi:probable F420-dependent oxidoreductase
MTPTRNGRPVRIGLQLQPQHATYQQLRDAVTAGEAAGVDVLFTWDHFFPLFGDPEGANFEAWTALAAWAEATSTVELGVLVTAAPYRNPDLLADMARTVDHISGGRLVLGIGAGWFERDFDEYGYDFGTAGSRIASLGEDLERIAARLPKLVPPPTREIPILIGGGGEKKTLPLVARHAHLWHSFGDAETLARKGALLDGYARDLGRDPHEIEWSVGVKGNPAEVGPAFLEAGATLLTVEASGPDHDLTDTARWVAWRDEVNAGGQG